MCVRESHDAGKHDLTHVNRSHGNEGSTKRRIEERGKRSLGRKITTRDEGEWRNQTSSGVRELFGPMFGKSQVSTPGFLAFSWATSCVSWVLHEPLNRWQLHYFLVINHWRWSGYESGLSYVHTQPYRMNWNTLSPILCQLLFIIAIIFFCFLNNLLLSAMLFFKMHIHKGRGHFFYPLFRKQNWQKGSEFWHLEKSEKKRGWQGKNAKKKVFI